MNSYATDIWWLFNKACSPAQQLLQGQHGAQSSGLPELDAVRLDHDCMLTSLMMKLISATTERFVHDRDVGPYSCVEGNPLQWRSAEVSCYRPVLGTPGHRWTFALFSS